MLFRCLPETSGSTVYHVDEQGSTITSTHSTRPVCAIYKTPAPQPKSFLTTPIHSCIRPVRFACSSFHAHLWHSLYSFQSLRFLCSFIPWSRG